MKLELEVVIFDFDGVIVDSGDDIAKAVQYTLKHFNRPVLTKEEIISYVGAGAESLLRRSFKDISGEMLKEVLPFYLKYYLENAVVDTRLYSNVKETLEQLNGKKVALVTNKPQELTLRILGVLGVRGYFHKVVGPESVSRMKPDPEGILKVLEEFRVAPRKAIMVGDSHTDIEAGKSAGTYTCGISYGLGDRDKLLEAAPDFVISDMLELLNYIE